MKLADFPVTPIIAMIVGKILGIMFSAIVFSIDFRFSNILELFNPVLKASDTSALVILSSYSDLFMFTFISTGLLLTLFLSTNKSPAVLNKNLIDKYLGSPTRNFVPVARKLYGSTLQWLIPVWIANLYILYNTLTGKTFVWIYLVVVLLSLSLTMFFYLDLKKEIELAKQKLLNNEL